MIWFIMGLIVGAILLWLFVFLRNKNITLTWYEWLIGLVGLFLLLFTIQNFIGSFVEMETTAAWLFLLVVGIPALLLLALAWQLALRRRKAS